jgi:ATP-dependent Lon protease
MEIIRISGYTHQEKVQIARTYLWPSALEDHGLTTAHVELTPEGLDKVIENYTQEAGVRSLKRELASVCRWCAKQVASDKATERIVVTADLVEEVRGPIHYWKDIAERTSVPGVATGLAWTAFGGEILFIEATRMKGKGGLTLTGSLGDVMKESVSVARSYVKSMADDLGIDLDELELNDLHIHVPSGAIPKDGPSAGVTMVTALTSLLTGLNVDSATAMTGEITLRGAVLPVGGIKEKVLAAHRAGITRVILPAKCKKDVVEVPEEIRNELTFEYVTRIEEVLDLALGKENLARVRTELALRKQAKAAAPVAESKGAEA